LIVEAEEGLKKPAFRSIVFGRLLEPDLQLLPAPPVTVPVPIGIVVYPVGIGRVPQRPPSVTLPDIDDG